MSASTFKRFAQSSDVDAAAADSFAAKNLGAVAKAFAAGAVNMASDMPTSSVAEAVWAADAKAVGLAAVPW